MNYGLLIIPLAYILDLVFGDPQWYWHPVRLIGRLIERLENKLNTGRRNKVFCGAVLVILVVGLTVFGIGGILKLSRLVHPFLFYIVSILFIYFSLSIRDLADEAVKIYKNLESGDIQKARNNLSLIVGRDTLGLNEQEIIRATVETVAESTMDGIIAPLFYAFLGGPVMAWVYKVINTLDSMVGYRNERFKGFGYLSAKLDGWLNFIPSKITCFLISVSILCCGKRWFCSLKEVRRYLLSGPGANSNAVEAVMAGGLGVQLGGTNFYDSVAVEKPFIGQAVEPLNIKHIRQSVMIAYVSSVLMLVIGVIVLIVKTRGRFS
ncbi:MAG: adenosylcobinamide-phosphate synthase CbiB [Candidatus Omnitrophica bacterium]|nr:adenosylcobinamide-phosphate synthase CbiB [Candidatus Omnitrophota bacterium]MBU4303864.1 adenosylcobinamide-phosphate synthase CbiB [Candidatus Omnitrophota bacterium]MBU4468807.1 adenosylcobinamide-phosphate synthase CbiB [Candidatus Omnitrophota bacterium]MCG2708134.1 adenosylcobinamide-phosphate synthase CbiB [Candidatus Omnitrophota bacterium]